MKVEFGLKCCKSSPEFLSRTDLWMTVRFVFSSEIRGSVLFRVIEFEAPLAASVGGKSIAISGKLRLVLLQAVQTFSSQELIYSHVVIVIMHPFS